MLVQSRKFGRALKVLTRREHSSRALQPTMASVKKAKTDVSCYFISVWLWFGSVWPQTREWFGWQFPTCLLVTMIVLAPQLPLALKIGNGAASGVAGTMIVFPLDTLKSMMQASSKG